MLGLLDTIASYFPAPSSSSTLRRSSSEPNLLSSSIPPDSIPSNIFTKATAPVVSEMKAANFEVKTLNNETHEKVTEILLKFRNTR